jgi:hypothetical protein
MPKKDTFFNIVVNFGLKHILEVHDFRTESTFTLNKGTYRIALGGGKGGKSGPATKESEGYGKGSSAIVDGTITIGDRKYTEKLSNGY